ncbi:MAG TPA: hypothetical protein VKY73_15335 [Polyangiaceae bacterium]|nr:hypothetical protein [Polyangiaceae bacterium]
MLGFGKRTLAVCLAALPVLGAHAQTESTDPAKSSRMTLEAYEGQPSGLWVPVYGSGRPFFNVDEIVFKPWAKGLFDSRQLHDLEPHARCKPSGAIRQFLTPYGVEIVEIEELGRLYIFDIGGPHTFREVFMDGRGHPPDLSPSYYGHNVGWWEGDTLVVDSVGYNEGFWFERMGLPHTEAVHVTEYFRRVDANTLEYTFVMEDVTAYDAPIEGHMTLAWREGEELFEYVCQQANYAVELMVHPEDPDAVRTSPIVP